MAENWYPDAVTPAPLPRNSCQERCAPVNKSRLSRCISIHRRQHHRTGSQRRGLLPDPARACRPYVSTPLGIADKSRCPEDPCGHGGFPIGRLGHQRSGAAPAWGRTSLLQAARPPGDGFHLRVLRRAVHMWPPDIRCDCQTVPQAVFRRPARFMPAEAALRRFAGFRFSGPHGPKKGSSAHFDDPVRLVPHPADRDGRHCRRDGRRRDPGSDAHDPASPGPGFFRYRPLSFFPYPL